MQEWQTLNPYSKHFSTFFRVTAERRSIDLLAATIYLVVRGILLSAQREFSLVNSRFGKQKQFKERNLVVTSSIASDWAQSQQAPSIKSSNVLDGDVDLFALKPNPLERGDTGRSVAILQAALKQLEFYNQEITGKFDERTADAVRALQDRFGLKISGKFDPATWYALTFWAA